MTFPVFARTGSIIPLAVMNDVTGRADGESRRGYLTLRVAGLASASRPVSVEVHDHIGGTGRTGLVNARDAVVTATASVVVDTHRGRQSRAALGPEGRGPASQQPLGRRFGYVHDPAARTVTLWATAHRVPFVVELDAVVLDAGAKVTVIDNVSDAAAAPRTLVEGDDWWRVDGTNGGAVVKVDHPTRGVKLLVEGIGMASF
jgi:hypothetical protein